MSLPSRSHKQGRIIVISAPSGAGKTTIVTHLLAVCPFLRQSVSYTTRKPRTGERHGRHYHFISRADFLIKRRRRFFLEWADVHGQFYGTSKSAVSRMIRSGKDVILTIDVQGMKQIQKRLGLRSRLVTIFLAPPSMAVLTRRLRVRHTETPAEIKKRLQAAKREMACKRAYHFVIVNRQIDRTVRQIKNTLYSGRDSQKK